MNSDFLKSLATKAALYGLGWIGARYHLNGEQMAALMADAGAAGALAYGWWAHWGMKKVPQDAKVIMTVDK